MMNIYFSRDAVKSGALIFPLVVIVSFIPFAVHPASLLSRHYDTVTLSCFAVIGLLILFIAAGSFFNALEFFFLGKRPAIVFQPGEMYVRRVGRKAPSEIRYSDIEQFYIEEIEGRSTVSLRCPSYLAAGPTKSAYAKNAGNLVSERAR